MAKTHKTNAARLLDRAKVAYELVAYPVDPDNLAATHVAEVLGEPVEAVYKTLVLEGNRTGLFACVVPADKEINLKKAAAASGNKSADMLPLRELLPATGYIRGGCTAIAMKKPMPVIIQQECLGQPVIYVSAGERGLQLKLSPTDYIAFTKATVADITTS